MAVITTTPADEGLGPKVLSVAVISPDDLRRGNVAQALAGVHSGYMREIRAYPQVDEVPRLVQQNHEVIIVDLDGDPEYALDLVEVLSGSGATTVMVSSAKADPELMVRCMRAGAREFLLQPIAPGTMAEALVRASVRRPQPKAVKKAIGKLLVFLGAKGGSGTTTLACNYAVAVAKESGQNTLLIDMDLPLGDATLSLGTESEYSTINALEAASRLDANFLSKLLVKHLSSGLSVLGAPGKISPFQVTDEAIEKLLTVARQEFEYVVVDAGTHLEICNAALLAKATKIFLVTQVTIPALRSANRMITQMLPQRIKMEVKTDARTEFKPESGTGGKAEGRTDSKSDARGDGRGESPQLEVVLNRSTARHMDIDEENLAKALTCVPSWRIPNDTMTARKFENLAAPLSLEDSPVARVIRQMAREISGMTVEPEKKKRFSLFAKKA